jgi:hypothetical protein
VKKAFAITGTACRGVCGMIASMRQGTPHFIIGADGRKRGVVLEVTHYRRLMRRIEGLEDTLALDRAAASSKKLVPYEAVRKRLTRTGKP